MHTLEVILTPLFPGFCHGKSVGTATPLCSGHPGALSWFLTVTLRYSLGEKWLVAGSTHELGLCVESKGAGGRAS